ncbi:hypothetical protein [Actinomadura sp. WMMB 499]|uniref:hypothetical protein n=1 Tax=Actinomadura sp. WMMB 499 TaxID=1219491 RepID=UPI00124427D3|nr:hypothetical protein [Actinomadura sp. WMMB 499]QFG23078.1 hypothetical protein F7P10_20075 [Actinomadura sp. WMMB 499]
MIAGRGGPRVFAAAIGLAGLAFLAACGGEDRSGGTGADGTGSGAAGGSGTGATGGASLDQRLKLARCMREHGVDMPDPKPGENEQAVSIGGNGVSPQELEAAMEECRQTAGMPAPKELTQKEKDDMLAYARCMRENGIDMPDPDFDRGEGMARAAPAPGSGPEKEKLDRAIEACGSR